MIPSFGINDIFSRLRSADVLFVLDNLNYVGDYMNHENWYNNFFNRAFFEVQINFHSSKDNKAEAEFIIKALNLQPGENVLDIPCGLGRLTMELAEYGCKMTGLDFTEEYLEYFKKAASVRNLEISFYHGDMRQPPWHEEFDAAFNVGGSFGYFDDDENTKFIKSVYDTLKPGGRFLLMCHVAESLFPMYQERDWRKAGDSIVLDKRSYDLENNRINGEWTIIQDNETTVQYSSMRIYTYSQMCDMFKNAGFDNLKAYGSIKGDPFQICSKRLYLVGIKKSA